jgi:hypothetical protein
MVVPTCAMAAESTASIFVVFLSLALGMAYLLPGVRPGGVRQHPVWPFLNWSQDELEDAAKVARKTIADFEREVRQPYPRTLAAIRAALEAAGVEFIAENGGGLGVRLKKLR